MVSGFGFRVSGFGFQVSRVSGFGFRVSGFGFRVSGFGFRVSGFGSISAASSPTGANFKQFLEICSKARMLEQKRSLPTECVPVAAYCGS